MSFSVASGSGFSSKNLGLRIQKKVLGKLSNKTVAKQFIDDDFSHLLDLLHSILAQELGDSKRAGKVVKNLIKITIKIGILYKNKQFNDEELRVGIKLRTKLRQAALTVVSFHEVDFSYDRTFLVGIVKELGDILHKLAERHLTPKSHQRINMVIETFTNEDMLDKVFTSGGAYHTHLPVIAKTFDKVVDTEW